jgi:hypothetical protein
MRTLSLALLVALCGVTSGLDAQSRVRFPASFYDIELRESLTAGTSSKMGGAEGVRATARGTSATGGFSVPESQGMAQFVVTADSMLFRNGRDIVEIAIADFTFVDEVRPMNRADLAWVRIQYTRAGTPKELFVRQYQIRNQAQLLNTLRTAVTNYEARRAQTP